MLLTLRLLPHWSSKAEQREVEQVNTSPRALLQREVSHGQEQICTQGANESASQSPLSFTDNSESENLPVHIPGPSL